MGHGLIETLRMYGRLGAKAGTLLAKNPAAILPAVLYGVAPLLAPLVLAPLFVGPLAIIGGFVMLILIYACCSAILAFTVDVVRYGRVRRSELGRAMGSYLSDVVNLGFALWGLNFIAQMALVPIDPRLYVFLLFVAGVLFNATPEVVAFEGQNAVQALGTSWEFIGTNWVEWFPPTIVLLLVIWLLPAVTGNLLLGAVLVAPVIAYGMIFRGLLFLELGTSSRRSREFKRRAAG